MADNSAALLTAGAVAATGAYTYYASKLGARDKAVPSSAGALPSGAGSAFVSSLAQWLVKGAEQLNSLVETKPDATDKPGRTTSRNAGQAWHTLRATPPHELNAHI